MMISKVLYIQRWFLRYEGNDDRKL